MKAETLILERWRGLAFEESYMRTGRHVGWLLFVLVLVLSATLEAQFATPSPSPTVDANTRFAFKLFKHLNTKTPDRNILVAPTGLSLTFGLLDNGSDPEARREIESAFEFTGLELAQVNDGFAALRQKLNIVTSLPGKQVPKLATGGLNARNPNGSVVADSLWIGNTAFASSFLTTSHEYYGV